MQGIFYFVMIQIYISSRVASLVHVINNYNSSKEQNATGSAQFVVRRPRKHADPSQTFQSLKHVLMNKAESQDTELQYLVGLSIADN